MKTSAVLSYILLFTMLFGFNNCSSNKEKNIVYDKSYLDEIKDARDDAMLFMTGNNVPGASYAISIEGELIYSEAMGLASKDLNVEATRDTKFRIGEVSELFTSLIYQFMVEDGTLHPDSTVENFLPEFPGSGANVKLQQLVNHTSGIREPRQNEEDWRGLNVRLQMGIDNFKNDSLVEYPGWFQLISMFNYNLLGAIMEKASDKTYSEILQDYITDTLNLNNTVVDHPFITIENRTDFFDLNYIAQVINATFRDMRYRAPSEGLLSTSEDLIKLGNAILYSDYISDNIKENLFKPISLRDGTQAFMSNGWMLLKSKNYTNMYGRSGKVTGGSAALLLYPKEKLVIATACNLAVNPNDIPIFKMAAHFLPEPETEEPEQNQESNQE